MAEVSGFSQFIEFMAGADAFTLLLPFLLSWMVFYFALEQADFLFSGKMDNMPPLVALILAFFTARFIVLNPFYQTFFIDFFGKITIGIIGVLGLLTLLAFVGYEDKIINKAAFALFMIMSAGAAFIYAGGLGPPLIQGSGALTALQGLLTWSLESGAVWALVIGLTLFFIVKEPSESGGNGVSPLKWLLNAEINDDAMQDTSD